MIVNDLYVNNSAKSRTIFYWGALVYTFATRTRTGDPATNIVRLISLFAALLSAAIRKFAALLAFSERTSGAMLTCQDWRWRVER